MHTFEAAYARIEELSKQVEALTNEKYQLMVERDDARADATRLRKLGANKAARIDRSRSTIRALVVAARAMADFPLLSFALRPEWTKRIRQSIKQAERGHAGKE